MSTEDTRKFESGATRNMTINKPDYEGFRNPEAERVWADYMHKHRFRPSGEVRDSDNWQRGIPIDEYMKSLLRHVEDLHRMHRGYTAINVETGEPFTKEDLCCAIRFNCMGMLKELIDPAPINQCRSTSTIVKPAVSAPNVSNAHPIRRSPSAPVAVPSMGRQYR